MTIRWLLAALHLLALGIGLGAVFARGQALRNIRLEQGLQRVMLADSFWGLSALLWIPTGLMRAFGGYEKGSAYYLGNTLFLVKMGLLVVILVLELGPMVRLIRWRLHQRTGATIDTAPAGRLAAISYIQGVLVILMVLLATAMARGLDI
jgi:putative membrane protein